MAEAMFAKTLANVKGIRSGANRWFWFFQTLFIGYPSTELIVKFQPGQKNE